MRIPSKGIEQHIRQLTFVSTAIMSGVVIFSGVVWYLVNGVGFTPSEGIPGYMATVLNLAALGVLVMALLLPRILPGPSRDEAEDGRLAWHRRNTLLGFALREGAAFTALVGVLLTGQQTGGFALAGLALISMAMAWPRADQLEGP